MFLIYNLFTLFNRIAGMIIKLFSSVETANLAVHFISRKRLLRRVFVLNGLESFTSVESNVTTESLTITLVAARFT